MISALLAMVMVLATPLLLSALMVMAVEKTGILFLLTEGMLMLGALTGYVMVSKTDSILLAYGISALVGLVAVVPYGLIIRYYRVNQMILGLAFTVLYSNLAITLGVNYEKTITSNSFIPVTDSLIGALTHLPLLTYMTIIGVGIYGYTMHATSFGLKVRAIGDNRHLAYLLGLPVERYRWIMLLMCGAGVAVSGAFISVSYLSLWKDTLINGKGWIVLMIVVFSNWQLWRLLLGVIIYTSCALLQLNLQTTGWVSIYALNALPFVILLLAVIVTAWLKRNKPNPYIPLSLNT